MRGGGWPEPAWLEWPECVVAGGQSLGGQSLCWWVAGDCSFGSTLRLPPDSDIVWGRPPLHTAHCTLHIVHCMLHTAHCTLHATHFTLHTAHCTLHTAHCTLHNYTQYKVVCRVLHFTLRHRPPPILLLLFLLLLLSPGRYYLFFFFSSLTFPLY